MELCAGVKGKEKLLVFVEEALVSDAELDCQRAQDVFECSLGVIGEICTEGRAEDCATRLLVLLLDRVFIGAVMDE